MSVKQIAALRYTFEFHHHPSRASAGAADRCTTRQVPYPELLRSFDAAMAWWLARPEEREVTLYGPGLARTTTDHPTREYILKRLPDNLPVPRRVLGVAWLRLDGSRYMLYKVAERDVWLPDFDAPGPPEHELAPIEREKWGEALRWVEERGWADYGIWAGYAPGLLWCGDFDAAERALLGTAGVAYVGDLGQAGGAHLMRAPVRYDRTAPSNGALPLMAPTRPTAKIHALRARFPIASEDLAVTPLDVLIDKYGYDGQRRMVGDPHHAPAKLRALAWINLTSADPRGYQLFRVCALPDGTGASLHALLPPKWHHGMRDARKRGWEDRGVWVNDGPGLIFCPPGTFETVAAAFAHLPNAPAILEGGALIGAPVRYGEGAHPDPYPHMAAIRTPQQIKALRAAYPDAPEDLKVCPVAVLKRRHGEPIRPVNATGKETDDE